MNRADRIKAAMNTRQRYRCYRSERIAYGFTVPTFRGWVNLGRPCVVHQSWKPGRDFLPRMTSPRPAWYPQRINNWEW